MLVCISLMTSYISDLCFVSSVMTTLMGMETSNPGVGGSIMLLLSPANEAQLRCLVTACLLLAACLLLTACLLADCVLVVYKFWQLVNKILLLVSVC